MFFVLLLLLASPISISSKSLGLYKHYELPTGANPLVGEHHSHDFAFFQRKRERCVDESTPRKTNEHFALFAAKTKYADAMQGVDTKFAMQ